MEANKLFKVRRANYQGNTGSTGGLILKGTVNATILGSQIRPMALNQMVDLTEEGVAITKAGAYAFQILPDYIYINGTATSVEIVNYIAEDLGAFPS